MTALRIALSTSVVFLLFIILPVSSLSAEPQGELYWMVETTDSAVVPEQTIFSYVIGTLRDGAWNSIDNACEQKYASISNKAYQGELRLDDDGSALYERTATCKIEETHPFLPPITKYESTFTAYTYCNGEQRAEGDTSPCPAPLIDANNLGLPCEE
ncbi:MAG: hypothetical protein D3910_00565 [Candidatus Electrothrix sp. ATG2]|nr:hypothetical protein [Candidatus Electrothrix sp. ATG2]